MSRSATPRVSAAAHSRVSSSVNRWDLVGTAPTERKSRIRNNEPREPRGLTRAVKPLWLYSAASLLFSLALFFPLSFSLRVSQPFSSPLCPALRLSASRPRQFPFPRIAIYILLHAMSRDSAHSKDHPNCSANSTFDDHGVTVAQIANLRSDLSRWKSRLKILLKRYRVIKVLLLESYLEKHYFAFMYLKAQKKCSPRRL